ncbi:unnamed protein product [Pedinophyceae sp. YPF-701]|nr:unnamed protein product [Pedinophyceae sp. YPF-701]
MAEAGAQTRQYAVQLAGAGGTITGSLRVTPAGMQWKSKEGGKTVTVLKADVQGLHWTNVGRSCMLIVGAKAKGQDTPKSYIFTGFRATDADSLRTAAKELYERDVQVGEISITGRNWGALKIDGASLRYHVDDKLAIALNLPDVSQVQLNNKTDVMVEFPQDDTAGNDDALMDMTFFIPATNEDLGDPADMDEDGPAKVVYSSVKEIADIDEGEANAVASFGEVSVIVPRGKFTVEMHMGLIKLLGQAQDFVIRYNSIARCFVLPKAQTPHTIVAISLDPPIRKGQTYYQHILLQFPSDEEVEVPELNLTPEQFEQKNKKCGGKLEKSYSGLAFDVFAKLMRGLAGAKLTRPGKFRTAQDDAYAVRCSYKADDGYLYPLERAFFYVHKPPMLIPHDDISSVMFERKGEGVSTKTFDLTVITKQDAEHQFRGIAREEWHNLLEFIQAKKLKIGNLREAQAGPGGARGTMATLQAMEGDVDHAAELFRTDDLESEDDEDFDAGEEGEPSDDDDSSLSEGGDEEPGEPKEKKEKKKKKRPVKEAEEEAPKKKKRAKKDPNAPKRNMSAYLYYSAEMRDKLDVEKPGLSLTEKAKLIGARWKELKPEDKEPYEDKARKDKERYEAEMQEYRAGTFKPAGATADGDTKVKEEPADAPQVKPEEPAEEEEKPAV